MAEVCDKQTGECVCRGATAGENCDECLEGYFGLGAWSDAGCIQCTCSGHSDNCSDASGWFVNVTRSDWELMSVGALGEAWTGEDEQGRDVPVHDPIVHHGGKTRFVMRILHTDEQELFFVATSEYLGDRRSAYGQTLYLELSRAEPADDVNLPPPFFSNLNDVAIEGQDGQAISTALPAPPGFHVTNYTLRIAEQEWMTGKNKNSPEATFIDVLSVLVNITAIKVRAKYSSVNNSHTDLYSAALRYAVNARTGLPSVNNVESCICPPEHEGQFCERCASGYTRATPTATTPYTPCVPCLCNNHSIDPCHSETGVCLCSDNTMGDHCALCARGYYGVATDQTQNDCSPCMCPGNFAESALNSFSFSCSLVNGEPVCDACTLGHTGDRCEQCVEGFYGTPEDISNLGGRCVECRCNSRADTCNSTTGDCEDCTNNTAGKECDICAPHYYGNALLLDCKECNCTDIIGSTGECDHVTGHCECLPDVSGLYCDSCNALTWNYTSGVGCAPCNCDPVGSFGRRCDEETGQCTCKRQVAGRECNICEVGYWDLSILGCRLCNCHKNGTLSDPEQLEGIVFGACELHTGQCTCRTRNVIGQNCDHCGITDVDQYEYVDVIYLGTFPMCEPCGECYDNYVATIEELGRNITDQHLIASNLLQYFGRVSSRFTSLVTKAHRVYV
ncbi:PREDICTED: laminin subunit gamma-1-like, partial [Priapulus caudatus]|uniref:Laminin subunit gamma-1-like n=1 Tax=Priapulus caudatus TaxID=37621 RepID=A0ABM1EE66_PRICU